YCVAVIFALRASCGFTLTSAESRNITLTKSKYNLRSKYNLQSNLNPRKILSYLRGEKAHNVKKQIKTDAGLRPSCAT
ncbi:MAG: hypothetical protein MR870_04090, partial [Clostridiales bacterium]|nr:hypothetical protein [Clostridiales bacterium]